MCCLIWTLLYTSSCQFLSLQRIMKLILIRPVVASKRKLSSSLSSSISSIHSTCMKHMQKGRPIPQMAWDVPIVESIRRTYASHIAEVAPTYRCSPKRSVQGKGTLRGPCSLPCPLVLTLGSAGQRQHELITLDSEVVAQQWRVPIDCGNTTPHAWPQVRPRQVNSVMFGRGYFGDAVVSTSGQNQDVQLWIELLCGRIYGG